METVTYLGLKDSLIRTRSAGARGSSAAGLGWRASQPFLLTSAVNHPPLENGDLSLSVHVQNLSSVPLSQP